ncbi:MAG: LysE family translocator [Thermoanaerobaculia bacterium]
MPDPAHFALFLGAAVVLLVIPGPAVLYITARSIDQGRMAGIVSVLGIAAGTLVHVFAAAVGISAILVRSALAFETLRYAGAAYLVYLGVTKLRSARTAGAIVEPPRQTLSQIFRNGITVNVLNPKTALFFFAFLPQFIDPSRSAATQIVILGMIFLVMGMASDSVYAIAAGSAADWLRGRTSITRGAEYAAGGVYIALGAMTALTGRRTK